MALYSLSEMQNISHQIRKYIFLMGYRNKIGNIASSFSSVEIIVSLYLCGNMNYYTGTDVERSEDVFYCKCTGALAHYAVLSRCGFFERSLLNTVTQDNSPLRKLPRRNLKLGLAANSGSLGHSFCVAGGVVLANKIDGIDINVYVQIGDGECQEGTIWEGAMFAAAHNLSNLIVIIDNNQFQAYDKTEKIISLSPFPEKWRSVGWEVYEVDGHDFIELQKSFEYAKFKNRDKPLAIIANTIKGKGISFMENNPKWHNRLFTDKEAMLALKELDITEGELFSEF